jgi:hypothetical protein
MVILYLISYQNRSFVGGRPQNGLIQEVGYFANDSGIILRASGTTVQFVIRNNTASGITENTVCPIIIIC